MSFSSNNEEREALSNADLSSVSPFSRTSTSDNTQRSESCVDDDVNRREFSNTPSTSLSSIRCFSRSSTLETFRPSIQSSELENETDIEGRESVNNYDLNLSSHSSSSESLVSILSSISSFNDFEDNVVEDAARWLDQPIYPDADLIGGNALCQILKVYVSNRLSKKALEDMLTTINILLPAGHILPSTNFKLLSLIDKILPHSELDLITKHRICSDCFYYLGKWTDEDQVERCARCNGTKLNSFFLEFNLESKLRNAFQLRDLHILMDSFRNECANKNEEDMYDITSGTEYRRLKINAIPGQYDLCLLWFTDGVQVSKSGKSHMWPIYAQIVDIDPKLRRSFQFVCGIFYTNRSSKKPDMNSYLKPFAMTLENLYTNGFEWRNQTLNRTIISKVVAPLASLDAPAKAAVENLMQYNGENGCSTCELAGESCETGYGSNWVFPITHDVAPLRSANRMEIQTTIAERYDKLKHFKGVKGRSIVTEMPHFDRSKGFAPEYMHGVLLGVMIMLLSLWTNSNNFNEEYYLSKEKREEIDKILENIAPPDDVTRTPRKLSDLSDWKASESREFLVHYGPIVLKSRLNNVHYEHFLLLSRAIYLLSQEIIDPMEIDLAETLLNIFVIDVERLYGRNKCSYNVHQLLHLAAYVRMWGPVWAWSAFPSEDNNGELLKRIHGSNKVDMELANTMKIVEAYRSIKYLMQANRRIDEPEWHTHGPSVRYDIKNSDREAIIRATHLSEDQFREVQIFIRCKLNEEIFTSTMYTRQKKRSNFNVQWKENGTIYFGAIKFFFKVEGNLYAVLRQFAISNDKSQEIKNRELGINFNENIQHVRDTYCTNVIPIHKIVSKILRVEDYVCHLPNNIEKK